MPVMTKQTTEPSVYDLSYPCYIAGIPEGAERIIHIPGLYEFKYLDEAYGYVVEAYKTKEQLLIFDCMTLDLWNKQKCFIEYQKRVRKVRELVGSQIANFKKVMDLPMVECETPIDAIDYLDNLLTSGYKKARIMYGYGHYIFGDSVDGEYVEIDL